MPKSLQDKVDALLAEREAERKHVEVLDKTVDALRDALAGRVGVTDEHLRGEIGRLTKVNAELCEENMVLRDKLDKLRNEIAEIFDRDQFDYDAQIVEAVRGAERRSVLANNLRERLRQAMHLVPLVSDDDLVRRADELRKEAEARANNEMDLLKEIERLLKQIHDDRTSERQPSLGSTS